MRSLWCIVLGAGVLVAAVGLGRAQNAAPALLPLLNPGFENGMESWGKKVDPLAPQALAVVTDVCRSGKAALRITQSHAGAYTNLCQMVTCQRLTNYVATGYIKAQDVVRRGIGVNLFIGDKNGHSVGDPIPEELHQGTYDWTRVVIPFNSGPNDVISVFPYLHEATGTVWFDDLELKLMGSWEGPAGAPLERPGPPTLTAAQGYDYDTVSTEVQTPHWAFGKPLWRELKLAVLAPALAQRETAELAQRLSCAPTAIMTHTATVLGATGFAYGALSLEQAGAMARAKLAAGYDCLLIGRQKWGSLPEDVRTTVLEKVRGGMGLVYVQPVGEPTVDLLKPDARVTPAPGSFCGLPLTALPAFAQLGTEEQALAKTVSTWALGKGRLAVIDYGALAPSGHHYLTPPTYRHQGGFRHYDYYQALLAKAVVWAAETQPRPHFGRLVAPAVVPREQPAELQCETVGGDGQPAQITVALRRTAAPYVDAPPVTTALTLGSAGTRLQVPTGLPAGDYYCDLTLRSADRVWDWATVPVRLTAPVGIAALELKPGTLPHGSTRMPMLLRLTRELPADYTVQLTVRDAYGRLIARQRSRLLGTEMAAMLDCARSRSTDNEVTAEILDAAGTPVAVAWHDFPLASNDDAGEFHSVVWGSGGDDYIAALLRDEMRRSGVDACDLSTGPWDAKPLSDQERAKISDDLAEVTRSNMAPLPYICRIWPAGNHSGETTRKPCLTDPAYQTSLRAALTERAALCRSYGPLGYTLGDENYLGAGDEYCLSPTCLAGFGAYLRKQYGTLARLNESWQTKLGDFTEARPLLRGEVKSPGDYPRWVDWRLYMTAVFAGAHKLGATAIRSVDPMARVGFDGAYGDSPGSGYDWAALGDVMRLWNVYLDQPVQVEALRSFASPDSLTGCWFGGYTYQRLLPAFQRWAPWTQLFNGCTSSWFYSPYTTVGGAGEIGFRPDLRPYDCWRDSARQVARIKQGVGKLLLACQRDNSRIAVVYSPASQMVTALDTRYGDHLQALRTVLGLLEDAGYQYVLLSERAIASPAADLSEWGAIVLPTTVALADGAGENLTKFRRGGGVLIADWATGLYDAHGKARAGGLLDECFGITRVAEGTVCALERGLPGLLPMARVDQRVRGTTGKPERAIEGAPVVIIDETGGGRSVYLNLDLRAYRLVRGPTGEPLQRRIRELLTSPRVGSPVDLRGQWGTPERVETVRWECPELTLIGLLKAPDTSATGEDVALTLPFRGHVYDVLAGKHIGVTPRVATHLGPGDVRLYAITKLRAEPPRILRGGRGAPGELAFRIAPPDPQGVPAVAVYHIAVTDPAGNLYPAAGANRIAPPTGIDYVVPLDLEPTPGQWTLTATDVATGQAARTHFTIRPR